MQQEETGAEPEAEIITAVPPFRDPGAGPATGTATYLGPDTADAPELSDAWNLVMLMRQEIEEGRSELRRIARQNRDLRAVSFCAGWAAGGLLALLAYLYAFGPPGACP